jgi:hypothetical protein
MEYQKMVLIPIEQYNHWKNVVTTTPSAEVLSVDHNDMLSTKTSTPDNKPVTKDVNKKIVKIIPKHTVKKKRLVINNKKKKTSLRPKHIKNPSPLGVSRVAASLWPEGWIKL